MKNISSNNKVGKLLWLFLTALLLLSVASGVIIFPVRAQEQTVYVDPPESIFYSNTTAVDDTFTVDVKIRDAANVGGVEFKLSWNSTILEGISIDLPTGHFMTPDSDAGNLWVLAKSIYGGYAEYAVTYYNITRAIEKGYVPKSGNGTLARITLKIVQEAPASCLLDLYDVIVGDPEAGPLPTSVEDGSYSYIVPPLPPALMKVEPETYAPTRSGEVFNINITIYDVVTSMKLVGLEFKLRYDTNFLEVVEVLNGTFMEQFGEVFYFGPIIDEDYILLGILLIPQGSGEGNWTTFPEGNGTLATITFNATKGPPSVCTLELFDTILADPDTNLLLHYVESGYYEFLIETLVHEIVWENQTFYVTTVSNGSITPVPMILVQPNRLLMFNVTGEGSGFVNITIPRNLLYASPGQWFVIICGQTTTPIVEENATHVILSLSLNFSTPTVYIIGTWVVPEMPEIIVLVLFLAATLICVAFSKMAWTKRRRSLTHCRVSVAKP